MSKSNLTDKQLAALGRVAVESAYMDERIDLVLSFLTNMSSDRLAIISPNVMIGSKLDTLCKFGQLRLKSKKRKAAFGALVSKMKHWNSQRTIAIHGIWGSRKGMPLSSLGRYIPPTGDTYAVHVKGGKEAAKLNADQLDNIANNLELVTDELFSFFWKAWIQPYARRSVARKRAKSL